jgi:carbonic anhydrase/acetyltransferase-like protein (isoleucine patch superfamily)
MIWELDGEAPEIHPSAWVAPNAQVIGRVRIGPRASVWFGAVLRGDNEWIEVGAGSNVQELCCLHTDLGFPLTIGTDCTVGHKAMLHGCTVGAGTLIGMSSTLLNGAQVGPNSLVGAGSLITENRSFEPRRLILGSPAKASRELDDEAVARLLEAARHYVRNAERFAAGLRPYPA